MRYKKKDNWTVLCRIYRGPLLMIEFLFLMGINVYGWRSSGVNHVLIFELDPRNHLSEQVLQQIKWIFYTSRSNHFPLTLRNKKRLLVLWESWDLCMYFQHIIEMATILGLVWSISILGFLYSDTLGVPPFVQPVRLYLFLFLTFISKNRVLRII